ncbi:MAG: biopolymer transporter ExbD [Candidatus Sulfotelmatobacter sp.]
MKSLISVCLLSIELAIANGPAFAQSSGPVSSSADQTMQRGISVDLAATNNAEPMPAADEQEAWIVTVTADGSLYFGTHSMTPDSLKEWMIGHPRGRDQKLYIKADARAHYAQVEKALDAVRSAAFKEAVLLTSQPSHAQTGSRVSPEGLAVSIAAPTDSTSKPTVAVTLNGSEESVSVKIDNQNVGWSDLQGTLESILKSRVERAARVEAGQAVPYSDIVHMIDICRSIGAKAVLVAQ